MPCLCSVLPSFARWLCPNRSLFGSIVGFVAALEHLEHFRTNLAHFKNSKLIRFDPTCIFLMFILLFLCVCVHSTLLPLFLLPLPGPGWWLSGRGMAGVGAAGEEDEGVSERQRSVTR